MFVALHLKIEVFVRLSSFTNPFISNNYLHVSENLTFKIVFRKS